MDEDLSIPDLSCLSSFDDYSDNAIDLLPACAQHASLDQMTIAVCLSIPRVTGLCQMQRSHFPFLEHKA